MPITTNIADYVTYSGLRDATSAYTPLDYTYTTAGRIGSLEADVSNLYNTATSMPSIYPINDDYITQLIDERLNKILKQIEEKTGEKLEDIKLSEFRRLLNGGYDE